MKFEDFVNSFGSGSGSESGSSSSSSSESHEEPAPEPVEEQPVVEEPVEEEPKKKTSTSSSSEKKEEKEEEPVVEEPEPEPVEEAPVVEEPVEEEPKKKTSTSSSSEEKKEEKEEEPVEEPEPVVEEAPVEEEPKEKTSSKSSSDEKKEEKEEEPVVEEAPVEEEPKEKTSSSSSSEEKKEEKEEEPKEKTSSKSSSDEKKEEAPVEEPEPVVEEAPAKSHTSSSSSSEEKKEEEEAPIEAPEQVVEQTPVEEEQKEKTSSSSKSSKSSSDEEKKEEPQESPRNPDEPPDFNIESEAEIEPFVLQLKEFLEKHDLDVIVKFKPKKMRGSTSDVDGQGIKTGEVNIPSDFKITGKDNNGKPLNHGGDDVVVKIYDPDGEEVPCEIVDNDDGTYDVKYTPTKAGNHKVECKVNDEEIEGTPIDVYVFDEIPDATLTTAEGPGLEEAETKTPAPFKIITRNKAGEQLKKGGQKFNVTVDGPTIPAEVTIKDNEDGTYDVEYVAKEPGNHKIDVQVEVPKKAECEEDAAEDNKEMRSIKDMPREVDVKLYHDDADPKQCWAEGPGVEGGCKTCDMAEFIIHAIKPNGEPCNLEENPFDVCVTDPDDEELETTIEKQEDGTYKASYKPTKPGDYNVEVIVRNPEVPSNFEHIKDSPFTPNILPGITAANCVVSGPGVDGDEDLDDCNDAEFTIQAKDYNGDEIKEGGAQFDIKVTDPNGDDVPCECVDNGDGTYSCKYAPEFPGNYNVDIKLKDDPVGKSPYEVMVGEGVDNDSSPVDCFQFTIKAKSKRGNPPKNAKFTVKITHESGEEVPEESIDIKALKEMKYRVTYKVSQHGDYTIHCLLNGRDIRGSPWNQQC